jgi:hypothetical protein
MSTLIILLFALIAIANIKSSSATYGADVSQRTYTSGKASFIK